jgi:hypothetical protein
VQFIWPVKIASTRFICCLKGSFFRELNIFCKVRFAYHYKIRGGGANNCAHEAHRGLNKQCQHTTNKVVKCTTPLLYTVSRVAQSVVSGYGLDDWAIEVRSPTKAKDFSSSLCVQSGSGAHPAYCKMGTEGPFPRA